MGVALLHESYIEHPLGAVILHGEPQKYHGWTKHFEMPAPVSLALALPGAWCSDIVLSWDE